MTAAGDGRRDRLARLPGAAHRAGAGAGGRGPRVRRGARRRSGSSAIGWSFTGRAGACRLDADGPPRGRRRRRGAHDRRAAGDRARARRRMHGGPARPRSRASSPRCRAAPTCWSTSATSSPARWRACCADARELWEARGRAGGLHGRGRARSGAIAPVPFDPRPGRRRARGVRARPEALPSRCASGALHDASELARVCPAAMIFSSVQRRSQPRARRGHLRGRPRACHRRLRRPWSTRVVEGACREAGARAGRAGPRPGRLLPRHGRESRPTERGVAGWVRNRPDGRLRRCSKVTGEAVDALVALCREGPAAARVEAASRSREERARGAVGFRGALTVPVVRHTEGADSSRPVASA